jgi:uncharacterized iron-regulated protein
MTLRALSLLALLAAACGGHRFDPRLVDAPIAGRTWVSTEHLKHPLVGKIWEPRSGRFVDEATLHAAVTAADYAFLGEVHDNPDHHLIQARLLRAITASGRRPAVGFEMLELDLQPKVDASLAAAPKDPDALGKAVGWDQTGWPEFQWYRPIFAAALDAGLPIVATNFSREQLRAVHKNGRESLPDGVKARLAREEPVPEATLKALRGEMAASHCGALPASMVDPLVLAQRARNAVMAERLEAAAGDRGGVLITGTGHVRNDRGVPAVVARDAPGKRTVSVALMEVVAGTTDPAAYHENDEDVGTAPFDFVVFTPGAKREDPCEAFRAHMKARPPEKPKDGAKDAAKEAAPKDAPKDAPGAAPKPEAR